MTASEGVNERIWPLIPKLLVDEVQFGLSTLTILLKLTANLIFDFLILEIGLPIKIFSLNETIQLILRTLQQNHIRRKLLILFNSHNIPNMNIPPRHFLESPLFQNLSLQTQAAVCLGSDS